MELQLAIAALVAGILTILAPCVFPILPILVGSSAGSKSKVKPLIITGSLMISIVVFTLAVRASANAFNIPQDLLGQIAGVILVIFGFFTIFPEAWDRLSIKFGLSTQSNKFLGKFAGRGDVYGDVMVGAALGPVFTSCSPTYAFILAIVIQGDVAAGTAYLILYAIGLGIMLLSVAYAGQALVQKLGWATNPHGWFKRIVGAIFIAIGVLMFTGWDKTIETWLLEQGFYDPIAEFENNLRE